MIPRLRLYVRRKTSVSTIKLVDALLLLYKGSLVVFCTTYVYIEQTTRAQYNITAATHFNEFLVVSFLCSVSFFITHNAVPSHIRFICYTQRIQPTLKAQQDL